MEDSGPGPGTATTNPPSIKDMCDLLRDTIGDMAREVKSLMQHPEFNNEVVKGEDRGEMKANIMLCYRHLEDARMRIGKVLQAQDGGVSVYDRPKR